MTSAEVERAMQEIRATLERAVDLYLDFFVLRNLPVPARAIARRAVYAMYRTMMKQACKNWAARLRQQRRMLEAQEVAALADNLDAIVGIDMNESPASHTIVGRPAPQAFASSRRIRQVDAGGQQA